MKKLYTIAILILGLNLVISSNCSAQLLNFDNPSLISGADNEVGAAYRFQTVQPGVDAIVTVDSIVNGAVLKGIDKTGWGYVPAFQPFIQPGSGTNIASYVVFTMKFVAAGTTTPYTLSTLHLSVLDIDGNSGLKEFDIVDMGGGIATYNAIPSEISLTSNGTAYKGINIAGTDHGGPDTTVKTDAFTVTKQSVSQVTIKAGTVGTSSTSGSRKYSFFPGTIFYPAPLVNLPVKLASFTAILNNDSKVMLNWSTVTEINVSHFVVERSLDGKNFSDAGMVFAYGNSTETKNYSFPDNIASIQSPVIYYRLRSVDIDGKVDYSTVRIIKISKQTDKAVSILTYPNPVTSELRITVPANWQNKKVTYEIVQANGQLAKRMQSASSSQTETINVSTMAPGFYLVKVSCENETAQQRIVKQ